MPESDDRNGRKSGPTGRGEPPGNSLGSMIGAIALGLIIAGIGSFFCYALWIGYKKAELSHDWPETPCVVTSSWVEQVDDATGKHPSFRFHIQYEYSYQGKAYTGKRIGRVEEGTTSLERKANEKMSRYPEGLSTVCYVDPNDPGFAILKHDSRAALYTIWFPGLFVIAGIGIAVTGIRGWSKRRKLAE